jgi:hypothetical protein
MVQVIQICQVCEIVMIWICQVYEIVGISKNYVRNGIGILLFLNAKFLTIANN